MRKIITEIILIQHKPENGVFADGLKIRVEDEGGGWYLKITGQDTSADSEAVYLQTLDEIDRFAETCKELLAQENDYEPHI